MARDEASGAVPRVVVAGAGPAGLAAAARLAERGAGRLDVHLFTRAGRARHLPGTLAVALGERPASDFEADVRLPGVACHAAEVTHVGPAGVVAGGESLEADVVVAALGLDLDAEAVPPWPSVRVGWDLEAAAGAAAALADAPGGRVVIAVCGLPYRCPPAPYSLAMRLADAHRRAGRFTRVCVATPEPLPLVAVGGDAPGFLLEACAGVGVQVERRFEVDLDASENGVLRSRDGRELDYEAALLIPPHRRSPALADVPGEGPLVTVGADGESEMRGLFVVGDATATPLPRAAGVAEAQGHTAADAVLARLGLAEPADPHVPEPSCYVLHGGGSVSRIRLRYPRGLPPEGEAEVQIEGPSPDLALAAEGERTRFLSAAAGVGSS